MALYLFVVDPARARYDFRAGAGDFTLSNDEINTSIGALTVVVVGWSAFAAWLAWRVTQRSKDARIGLTISAGVATLPALYAVSLAESWGVLLQLLVLGCIVGAAACCWVESSNQWLRHAPREPGYVGPTASDT